MDVNLARKVVHLALKLADVRRQWYVPHISLRVSSSLMLPDSQSKSGGWR